MSIAMRVKSLLERHGDSFRTAAKKTGVSYETIRRIVNGYDGPTLSYHVIRIAHGYGIGEKSLLEGLDPKGDFEWTIHHSPPTQRLDFLMMSRPERVKLTWDFLRAKYPSAVTLPLLAAASGLHETVLTGIMSRWDSRHPDINTTMALANGLHRITGISLFWFDQGWLEIERAGKSFPDRLAQLCLRSADQSRRHTPKKTHQLIRFVNALVS